MSEIKYWTGEFITSLKENQIFVFGSNPTGDHGFGAAATAKEHFGAISKKGRGLMGQSYGLVTKNLKWNAGYYEKETGITYEKGDYRSVSLEQISDNVLALYQCAKENPDKEFLIVYKSETWPGGNPKKSLNGYFPLEMLSCFMDNKEIPENIVFHDSFKKDIDLKLKGMTNAGITKKENMTKIKDAYTKAQDEGTVRTSVVTNGQVAIKDAYDTILKSKSKKQLTCFFSQYDVFSQWHPSKFECKGYKFTSAEQFMMFSKAKLFKDELVADEIMELNKLQITKDYISGKLTNKDLLSNDSPEEYLKDKKTQAIIGLKKIKTMGELWSAVQAKVKALGKLVSKNDGMPWDEELWKEKREGIIYSGSRLKYGQNEDMKQKLLSTKGTIMVEASPWDKIYGVGMRKTDSRISDPSNWEGLNLLGKGLTNLRYEFTLDLKNQKEQKKTNNNRPRNRP